MIALPIPPAHQIAWEQLAEEVDLALSSMRSEWARHSACFTKMS